MNKAEIETMFQRFAKHNPAPTTELCYQTPFELLIAVILSARATDISVNKATAQLYPVANTPKAILKLGQAGLKPYIQSIGLYPTKGKNIIKTCEILIQQHQGEVPQTREALEALPGVGRKTANVILNTLFGESTIAVDTHIFRVSNRTGLAPGKTPLEVERKLLKVVPKLYQKNAHHWLILHGRYICKARQPQCKICLMNDVCEYAETTLNLGLT